MPPPTALRSRCRRSERSCRPSFHRRGGASVCPSPGHPGRPGAEGSTGFGSERRSVALCSRSRGRGLRRVPRWRFWGPGGRRRFPGTEAGHRTSAPSSGGRPSSSYILATTHTSNTTLICDVAPPANTARRRGNVLLNTVRNCFATICSVTECAVPDAMGNKVIVSYPPGNALRRVIDTRSEGSFATADTTVHTGRADWRIPRSVRPKRKDVPGYCPRTISPIAPDSAACGAAWRARHGSSPCTRMGSGIDGTVSSLSHGVPVRFPPVVVAAGWHCGMREYEHDEAARAVRPR